MPIAMTQEQQALQASLRDWAKRADPLAVVRAMDPAEGHGLPQAGAALLTDLAALGVFAIPSDGGTVTDLAAALEELACALVPGPVLPTLLATLILGRHADGRPAVRELLPALAQGRVTASVALTPGTLTGTRQPDGSLRVSGEIAPVLWAAGHLLAPAATAQGDTWFLATPGLAGLTVNGLSPVDFSRELAAVRFDEVTVPPEQILTGLDTGSVRDLAATLHAAEAAGVAAWCSATAADYARTRRQFGRLIGEFQAVKHLCATTACRAERAAALAWDAARAADEAPAEHPLAAAAAAALALDDAVGITYFLVDMHAPGLDIRPLREITGRAVFNEVFLDQVFVPGDCVLGEAGDGWRIAMSTLANERTAIGGGPALDEGVQRLLAADGAVNPLFTERTGVHVAGALAVALLGVRATHPAIRKLIGTEHRQAVAETVLELLGPVGAAETEASYEFLLTRYLSIAGGTTQILLNQVAERVLGLPR